MSPESKALHTETGLGVLFTLATIGIVTVNSQGIMVNANPFFCRMLGYTEQELTGKKVSILVPGTLKEKHKEHIHAFFECPENRPMGQGMQLLAVKKGGEEIYVEISLSSYIFNNERFALAFMTDVTRQKEKETQLKKYRERLETLVKERTEELHEALEREKQAGFMKSRFVSFASHEFRTPLSTILSSANLIGRYNEQQQADGIRKHVGRISNAINTLTNVLDDFLSLDKLEQGAVVVNKTYFHLPGLIRDTSDELEHYLKPGQAIIHLHRGMESVYSDKKILKNILLNLLSNASKYSAENKTIRIHTHLEGEFSKIEIIDEGIGIPAGEQDKLFTMFYRGSNVGTTAGTGLGLNLVSRYVGLLGGRIGFSSVDQMGTRFSIDLPPEQI